MNALKLDPSRLLGFRLDAHDTAGIKSGAKSGSKFGNKKTGKADVRQGPKAGCKTC